MTKLISPRWSVLSAIMIGVLGAGVPCSAAEETPAEKKSDSKPKIELPPAAEAKLSEFLTKVGEAKRKLWIEQIKKDIAEMTKTANLDAEEVKKLEAIAADAANLCREGWAKKGDEFWRRSYAQQPGAISADMFDQLADRVEMYARYELFSDYVRPQEHPTWTEGIKSILSADQLAVWEKAQADRKEALSKEITEFLKSITDENRDNSSRVWTARGGEIQRVLGLSKERMEQMNALTNSVVDQGVDSWRKGAEKNLLAMDESQRKQMFKMGNYYGGMDEDELERLETQWKEGVAKLLSPEENQRLETFRQERKARRVRAMGRLLISQLDQKVAFTSNQRERLRPLAERLATTIAALFPKEGTLYNNSVAPASFFMAGAKANEQELKEILDPLQVKHWQEACTEIPESNGRRIRRVVAPNAKPTAEEEKAVPNSEPEEVEKIISDFFRDQTASVRKRVLTSMIVQAEDAARVAMVNPQIVDHLQTAARGSAEQALASWRDNLEENIRPSLSDANAENLKQRLASIPEYQYHRSRYSSASSTILDETIKTELNDDQRAGWKKEVDARADYRSRAISAFLMAQFGRTHLLTSEQFDKLTPKIEQIVKDYSPDIGQMFSYDSGEWYLGYYSFMPFLGVPEKDMKDILTKDQWEAWTGSNEFSNATNFWENVNRNHQQRVKEVKH